MEIKNVQGHKKESCIKLKSIAPIIICVCIYVCFLTESHWLLIKAKKRKMFAEKCVWKLRKKVFNQNYVFNSSTSTTQLESEIFFSFYCFGWEQLLVMTQAVFSSLLLQAAVYAFLFEISWNHFKHFPVSSGHTQYQDKNYSICPSQDCDNFIMFLDYLRSRKLRR